MMDNKILKQTAVLFFIALALFLSKNSHIQVLEKSADTVLNYMEVNYTFDDVKGTAGKSVGLASSFKSKVSDTVHVIAGKPSYGEPIDEEYSGNETTVHAVAGGEVTAVGENEEIGKYVKITHGDAGESLYGNLKSVSVTVPSKVKKGEIIGIYERSKEKEFYYSFREFN